MSEENGVIYRISGPVVTATGIRSRMYEVVRVGHEGLMGDMCIYTVLIIHIIILLFYHFLIRVSLCS